MTVMWRLLKKCRGSKEFNGTGPGVIYAYNPSASFGKKKKWEILLRPNEL